MKTPDSYTLPNGNLVFTESYHLKRGYCCGSGCLHCPYVGGKGSTQIAEPSESSSAPASNEVEVQCPFCFEKFLLPVSTLEGQAQRFVYDCEVCCNPIDFLVECQGDDVEVSAGRAD